MNFCRGGDVKYANSWRVGIGVAAIANVERMTLFAGRGWRVKWSRTTELVKQHDRLLPSRVYTSRGKVQSEDVNFERHCAVTCTRHARGCKALAIRPPFLTYSRRYRQDNALTSGSSEIILKAWFASSYDLRDDKFDFR